MKKINILVGIIISLISSSTAQIINREPDWLLSGDDTIFVEDISINTNSNEVKLKYTSKSGKKYEYQGSECSKFKVIYNDGELYDYVNYLRGDKKCYTYAIRFRYGAISLNKWSSTSDLSETFVKLPSGKWYWCYGKPLKNSIIPKLLECKEVNDSYAKVNEIDINRLILMINLYNENCGDKEIEEK